MSNSNRPKTTKSSLSKQIEPKSSSSLTTSRLLEEKKTFRKKRPPGFLAGPRKKSNGTRDLMIWDCIIPGPKDTLWEGGRYPVKLSFPDEYPNSPPTASFEPGFQHINVFDDGAVCLSILQKDVGFSGWNSSLTVADILMGIQNLLKKPNPKHLTGKLGSKMRELYENKSPLYEKIIKKQQKKYS